MGLYVGYLRSRLKALSVVTFLLSFAAVVPAAQQRIRAIDDSEFVALRGHIRPAVAHGVAQDQGELPSSTPLQRLYLHFAMTDAQRADLTQLLKAQQDRRSPQYRHFLTPEQYASRFGLASSDVQKVQRWLENNGFSIHEVARSRTWISFSGTAGQAAAAFHTPLHHYSIRGESRVANAFEPQLPRALAGVVQTVLGLHDIAMKPHSKFRPHFFWGPGESFTSPDDWETIYNVKPLYGAGLDGSNVDIAVVGQSNIHLTDIRAFRSAAGLSPNDPAIIVPPSSQMPGYLDGDESESDLDLEWSGAIAPNAHIIFVTADSTRGRGVHDAEVYAIDNNIAPIMSISYGLCEADLSAADFQALDSMYQQANAQGITVIAASGDGGAAGCDSDSKETSVTHGLSVDFPASSAYVTGVGGTAYSNPFFADEKWGSTNNNKGGSVTGYVEEYVWNEGIQAASGGGVSTQESKPAWQAGLGVPADNMRDVPDVSFTASAYYYGLLICSKGSCVNGFGDPQQGYLTIGGTSAGAPPMAAIIALLIQNYGGSRVGNINQNLYSLAQVSSNAIHDITGGTNLEPCQLGSKDCSTNLNLGYYATSGYDQASGLGSLDAYNAVEQWNGDIQVTASPLSVTIQPGTLATATIRVSPTGNFSGDVSFACSVQDSLIDVTCSVPNSVVHTTGSITLSVMASTNAHSPLGVRFRHLGTRSPLTYYLLALIGMSVALLIITRPRVVRISPKCLTGFITICVTLIFIPSCGGGGSAVSSSSSSLLTITCNLPTQANVGVSYSGTCSASGGSGGNTFSVSAGSLPPGVNLDAASGSIMGVPSVNGTDSFTITVTDNSSHTASFASTTLSVTRSAFIVACDSDNAKVGRRYNIRCQARMGVPPYSYSVASGALPAGLTLDLLTGIVSGVPTTYGTASFTVQATDSGVPVQTTTIDSSILVADTAPPYVYCSGEAYVDKPYVNVCQIYEGNPPFTLLFADGSLPPGISVDSAHGSIAGKPTVRGSYNFRLQVNDSSVPPLTTFSNEHVDVEGNGTEYGKVTVTATSGGIVSTVAIDVAVLPTSPQ